MNLEFSKMEGAGNDFIVADNSAGRWPKSPEFIRAACDRHRGIGADGLILLSPFGGEGALRMDFYNCDGTLASLCGNGLRCAAEFARASKLAKSQVIDFSTDSGKLSAKIVSPGVVRIQMPLTEAFSKCEIDPAWTVYKGAVGVPHAVIPVPELAKVNVAGKGRHFRRHPKFAPDGANVNFVQIPASFDLPVLLRTYERGVEAETLACGTGATSTAICLRRFFNAPPHLRILCAGGDILEIELIEADNILKEAYLTGPAKTAFRGTIAAESFPG